MLLLAVIGFVCFAPGLAHHFKQKRIQFLSNVFLVLLNGYHIAAANTDFHFPIDSPFDRYPSRTPMPIPIASQSPISPPEIKSSDPTTCIGPDRQNGLCTHLEDCQPLKTRLLQNPSDATFINELKISNQLCGTRYAVICCPLARTEPLQQPPLLQKITDDSPRKPLTLQEGCGYRKPSEFSGALVVGGVPSELGAWPWIALIGYNGNNIGSPFKCGGTLITSRHVLTAAHCIKSNLAFVRLGEHNLSVENETYHIDVPVARVRSHLNYNSRDGHSDIAMLYLVRNVQLTLKINPICLPFTRELLLKSFVSSFPFVAGWGRTMEGGQPSDVLQELRVPVQNNSVCKDLYQKQNKLISQQQFDNAVLCAGDLEGGKDTCQGDSGGPLMIAERFGDDERFNLIGIVSYGIGCARPDSPGVYTRVTNFMDWITETIQNTNLFTKKLN